MTAGEHPKFLVDHMLVKLGKYLRILGFDAAWDPGLRTHELILMANREGRLFLTRNRRLSHQYPQAAQLLVLETDDPVEQLRRVTAERRLGEIAAPFTRCIRCNVELEEVVDRESIRSRVHPNVFGRHTSFFRCPWCLTVFWNGSHVSNTCRKLGLPRPE
jgi:uncharacterized protein